MPRKLRMDMSDFMVGHVHRKQHMAETTMFRQAQRANSSILSSLEKRLLIWIAERLPAWVNSDHLTALGFVSLIATGVMYWHMSLIWAIVFLGLNWFGDSLDGTLARVRNRQRPRYGFYVDHIL